MKKIQYIWVLLAQDNFTSFFLDIYFIPLLNEIVSPAQCIFNTYRFKICNGFFHTTDIFCIRKREGIKQL